MLPTVQELRVPRAQRARAEAIFALTDAFCLTSLDAEYAVLCRRLVARLARKRPSPLERGQVRTWAGGVVYAVGRLNFLFDRAQNPHLTADELANGMGVAKSTMSAKAGQICSVLALGVFEPELSRAELIEDNPLAWLVAVNGLVVDARMLPAELQRAAHAQGVIPFVAADAA